MLQKNLVFQLNCFALKYLLFQQIGFKTKVILHTYLLNYTVSFALLFLFSQTFLEYFFLQLQYFLNLSSFENFYLK